MSALVSGEFWALVGTIAGIYSLLGLSIQLQFGTTGLMIFAQTAYMAVGAYTMAILTVRVGVGLPGAVLIAIAAAMLFSFVTTMPAVRLRGDYLAIFTLASAEIVRHVARNADNLTGGAQGSIAIPGGEGGSQFDSGWRLVESEVAAIIGSFTGNPVSHNVTMLVIVWTVFLLISAPFALAVRSPWGRVAKAIREDELAAGALGKRIKRIKLQVGVLGGAIGAIAGILFAFHFGFFVPDDFAPLTLLYVWTAVILGGMGRWWTVPVGSLVFGTIYAGTRFLEIPPIDLLGAAERAYVRLIVVGLLIIALMAFRPQGLLGRREDSVLHG